MRKSGFCPEAPNHKTEHMVASSKIAQLPVCSLPVQSRAPSLVQSRHLKMHRVNVRHYATREQNYIPPLDPLVPQETPDTLQPSRQGLHPSLNFY